MKKMYFILFSLILLGLNQTNAQTRVPETVETGTNARAANVGIVVNVRRPNAPAPVIVQADDLKKISRSGLRFQLLDADGKVVARGEHRVKYNETDGKVDVDIVGLPEAPKGRNYRVRITDAKKAVVGTVDLK